MEPWRARPVPFWRHGLMPPPETGQSALRALTAVGQMVLYDVVNDSLIGLDPENGIRELDLADLLTSHIKNFSLHDLLSSLSGFLPKPSAGWYARKPSAG